jgi:hypothetical protein
MAPLTGRWLRGAQLTVVAVIVIFMTRFHLEPLEEGDRALTSTGASTTTPSRPAPTATNSEKQPPSQQPVTRKPFVQPPFRVPAGRRLAVEKPTGRLNATMLDEPKRRITQLLANVSAAVVEPTFEEWQAADVKAHEADTNVVGRAPYHVPLVFPKAARLALPPGSVLDVASPAGALFDSPINPACAAFLDMQTRFKGSVNLDYRVLRSQEFMQAWPWGWGTSGKEILPAFCSMAAQLQGPRVNGIAKPTPRYRWNYYWRNEPSQRRHWILRNIGLYAGRYYADDSVVEAMCARCHRENRSPTEAPGTTPTVCDEISLPKPGKECRAFVVHFAGYFPFIGGLWPRVKYDSILIEALSTSPAKFRDVILAGQSLAKTAASKRPIVHAAAVWVPPTDLGFSYHLLADLLLPLFQAFKHRAAAGLPTTLVMNRPNATRYGFTKTSCHYGTEVCLDADTDRNGDAPSSWSQFIISFAGKRGNIIGNDEADRIGDRGFVFRELFAGAPANCELSQGRGAAATRNSPKQLFTYGAADCARAMWEFQQVAERLVYKGAAPSNVVEPTEATHILFLSRGEQRYRRLMDEDAVVAHLRAAFPKATLVVRVVSTLHESFRGFREATVVVAAHGAALVNAVFMRVNAGIVVLDTDSPPMGIVPSWVHFDAVRADCVGNCGKVHAFHDMALSEAARERLVDAVKGIEAAQQRGLETMVTVE